MRLSAAAIQVIHGLFMVQAKKSTEQQVPAGIIDNAQSMEKLCSAVAQVSKVRTATSQRIDKMPHSCIVSKSAHVQHCEYWCRWLGTLVNGWMALMKMQRHFEHKYVSGKGKPWLTRCSLWNRGLHVVIAILHQYIRSESGQIESCVVRVHRLMSFQNQSMSSRKSGSRGCRHSCRI